MIELKNFIKIVLVVALCLANFWGFAQGDDPYADIEQVELFESKNDSLAFATNFWTSTDDDDLSDFLAEYESFDSYTIHYPKTDFSNKEGVTMIPLISDDQRFVYPCDCPPGLTPTSRFGSRRNRYHYGIDTRLRTGDPVYTVFDGVVRIARRSPTYGFLVVVRHHNGLETYYAHLSRLLVEPEQEVKAGELIGLGGNTGRSRGSHLHFEVRYMGAPINPEDIIDFNKRQLKNPILELSAQNFGYLEETKKLAEAKFHTVRSGDTLGALARRYGTSVNALCSLNGIRSSSTLRIGQRLRVR
ncbi:MAG: M23 family metallopeptidase [Bacteroidales bacterium]|nr:M23 family metallopeptidase [Bacteroidales bacterium]